MQFSNKVAVITGGASGLGLGIAKILGQRNAKLALIDINDEKVQEAAESLLNNGVSVKAFQADVTNEADIDSCINSIEQEVGKIDILVNSAGVIAESGFEDSHESSVEDWDITYAVNVKGTFIVSSVVAKRMKPRNSGKIVNISSHASRIGGPGQSAYGASKAAVLHLTQSQAMQYAPFNINVNVICPGSIWTPMWERIAEKNRRNNPDKSHMTGREIFLEQIENICPLKREQTPEDIGNAVAFFASDDAVNITGQSLNVNGGTRMN